MNCLKISHVAGYCAPIATYGRVYNFNFNGPVFLVCVAWGFSVCLYARVQVPGRPIKYFASNIELLVYEYHACCSTIWRPARPLPHCGRAPARWFAPLCPLLYTTCFACPCACA